MATADGVELFSEPEELAGWCETSPEEIRMTAEEAGVVLGYLTGHGYAEGLRDGQPVFVDVAVEDGEIMPDTMEELICRVCEWNFELTQELQAELQLKGELPRKDQRRLDSYNRDSIILDGLFNQTALAKELQKAAHGIAEKSLSMDNRLITDKKETDIIQITDEVREEKKKDHIYKRKNHNRR